MDCPSCHHENRPKSRFCLECGSPLAAACAACGAELPVGAKFCDTCGANLVGSGQSAADSSVLSSNLTTNNLTTNNLPPRAYTPKHLADKILQSKSALEGERKQVTVLFADVKGSMEALPHWRRIPVLLDGVSDAEAAGLVRTAVQQILLVGGLQGIAREEADALLATGRRLAENSRDPQALPQMLVAYGTARVLGGDAAAGLGVFQEATALARGLPDQSLHWYSRSRTAWALLSLGRLRESLAECEAIPNASGGTDPLDPWVLRPRMHIWVLIELGRLQESARVLARLHAESAREILSSGLESRLHAHLGQLDRALRTATECVAFAERSHNANSTSVAMTHLGRSHALRAQWPEAVAALERGLHVAREAGTMLNLEAETLATLAHAYLGQGDLVKALATAREAIAVARTRGARHHEAPPTSCTPTCCSRSADPIDVTKPKTHCAKPKR